MNNLESKKVFILFLLSLSLQSVTALLTELQLDAASCCCWRLVLLSCEDLGLPHVCSFSHEHAAAMDCLTLKANVRNISCWRQSAAHRHNKGVTVCALTDDLQSLRVHSDSACSSCLRHTTYWGTSPHINQQNDSLCSRTTHAANVFWSDASNNRTTNCMAVYKTLVTSLWWWRFGSVQTETQHGEGKIVIFREPYCHGSDNNHLTEGTMVVRGERNLRWLFVGNRKWTVASYSRCHMNVNSVSGSLLKGLTDWTL